MASTFIQNQVKAPFTSFFGLVLRSPNKKYLLKLETNNGLTI